MNMKEKHVLHISKTWSQSMELQHFKDLITEHGTTLYEVAVEFIEKIPYRFGGITYWPEKSVCLGPYLP